MLYVVMLGHCVSQSSYNTCAENNLRLIVKCNIYSTPVANSLEPQTASTRPRLSMSVS